MTNDYLGRQTDPHEAQLPRYAPSSKGHAGSLDVLAASSWVDAHERIAVRYGLLWRDADVLLNESLGNL